jgi:hypothetical protein
MIALVCSTTEEEEEEMSASNFKTKLSRGVRELFSAGLRIKI